MKTIVLVAIGMATLGAAAGADPSEPTPFRNGETLKYEIVWPSGLRMGDAEFSAHSNQAGWSFAASLSANLPVLAVEDRYQSQTDFALCSTRFEKTVAHGSIKQHEEVEFDQAANKVLRRNLSNSSTQELSIPPCGRDALTYLYSLRQDLAQGRVPPPDDFNYGTNLQLSVSYVETRMIDLNGKRQQADRLLVDVTGGEKLVSIELFLAKDDARTPLLIRVPFELGTFALQLVE